MVIGATVSSEFLAVPDIQRGLIIPTFSVSELATVLWLGTLTDRLGRRPVLLTAHLITGVVAFAFVLVNDMLTMVPLMLGFGVGAAAQVASSLATVSDHSRTGDRARLMAFYDMFTMGGLAAGYVAAILLTRGWSVPFAWVFLISGSVSLVAGGLAFLFMRETSAVPSDPVPSGEMIRSVIARRDVQRLLPVYTPIIAIYGMVLSFTRSLIEAHDIQVDRTSLFLLGLIGGGLIISMIVSGYLSDRVRKRRPFIIIGLACFGLLASVLIHYADDLPMLAARWYLVLPLSLGAGAFPPAILAYLSDISRRETRGTTFGVYSLIFGTGMIIGPVLGGFALQTSGQTGFIAMIFAFVLVSCISTLALRERVG